MKKLILTIFLLTHLSLIANPKVPISITCFRADAALSGDNEDGCRYWAYFGADTLGGAFQERLIAELLKDPRFVILERETLSEIYSNEIDLKNAERTQPIERGHFNRARYTLVGTVKSFAWCSGGEEVGVNIGNILGIGDLNIGGRKNRAEVTVEVRVIDTKSGKVVNSVTGHGSRENFTVGAEGAIKGIPLNSKKFRNTPIGEAIDEAISDAAKKLREVI